MILIDALFINKGGGAVLLEYLIEEVLLSSERDQFFFLLDPRFKKPTALTNNFTIIPNRIKDRITYYRTNKTKFTKVFCFANTPPPIKLSVPTYTYLHNQKLLDAPKHKFNPRYMKLYVKYLFIRQYRKNTDLFIVQTAHMLEALAECGLKKKEQCLAIPFYDISEYSAPPFPFDGRPDHEYVFVSNPSPQKNHVSLFDAWEYLHSQGLNPVLHVTIDDTAPALSQRMAAMQRKGIKIVNHVNEPAKDLYFNYRYLIFPSVMESFGLPLVEAVAGGMKVLASDMDYVYDVIAPSTVFDPYEQRSIADAVVRSMNGDIPFPTIKAKNDIAGLMALLLAKQ
jgi:glycosyltransferase involved in cell wall biosynthesis